MQLTDALEVFQSSLSLWTAKPPMLQWVLPVGVFPVGSTRNNISESSSRVQRSNTGCQTRLSFCIFLRSRKKRKCLKAWLTAWRSVLLIFFLPGTVLPRPWAETVHSIQPPELTFRGSGIQKRGHRRGAATGMWCWG